MYKPEINKNSVKLSQNFDRKLVQSLSKNNLLRSNSHSNIKSNTFFKSNNPYNNSKAMSGKYNLI